MTSINGIPTPAPALTIPTPTTAAPTSYVDSFASVRDVLDKNLGTTDPDAWASALMLRDDEREEFHAWWEATHGPGAMTPDVV